MKKIWIAGLLASGMISFTACSNDNANGEAMATDTVMTTPADGSMMASDAMPPATTTTTTDPMGGTTNADGSVTYQDGVMRDAGGTWHKADGSTMTDDEIKSYQSVQGRTITTDGTVRDRDGDGRVGTAEVAEHADRIGEGTKEVYKDARAGVQKGAREVKEEYKERK